MKNELKFYYGLEGSGTDKKLPYTENIFISASSLYNKKSEKFTHPKLPAHSRFMLDSGGFSFFTKYKKFPYTPKNLAELSRDIRPDFVATMDFPCEKKVLEKHNSDVKTQIEKTIHNAKECMQHRIPGIWLPVIQGSSIEDYLYCIDRMKEENLMKNYMAVGSVCVREKVSEMTNIVSAIYSELPDIKLHFFGLSINALKKIENFQRIYSTDTTAWKWNHWSYGDREGYMPKNEEDKLNNYKIYKRKVNSIISKHKAQQTLEEIK